MKTIQGDLGLMSLQDLLQWGSTSNITGALKVKSLDLVKTFYLQEGKIVFLTSNKEGERVGEFLAKYGELGLPLIRGAIEESQRRGIPFTAFLLSAKIMDTATLSAAITQLVIMALADCLSWTAGAFQLSDALPPAILNGPIKLDSGDIFERAQAYQRGEAGHEEGDNELLRQIAQRINSGDIDIPPVPDILVRLNECMTDEGPETQEVLKIIMADQILTSKILKVVNSSFYGFSRQVTSLQHAIVFIGFKQMLNIVTAYSLNKIIMKNSLEIKEILRHSLMCAFLAKRLGASVGLDEEEAFVCGLLHDIGKTVLYTLFEEYDVDTQTTERLLASHHPQAGSLLTIKWQLPEMVRNAVRFHHTPERASHDHLAAEMRLSLQQTAPRPRVVRGPGKPLSPPRLLPPQPGNHPGRTRDDRKYCQQSPVTLKPRALR